MLISTLTSTLRLRSDGTWSPARYIRAFESLERPTNSLKHGAFHHIGMLVSSDKCKSLKEYNPSVIFLYFLEYYEFWEFVDTPFYNIIHLESCWPSLKLACYYKLWELGRIRSLTLHNDYLKVGCKNLVVDQDNIACTPFDFILIVILKCKSYWLCRIKQCLAKWTYRYWNSPPLVEMQQIKEYLSVLSPGECSFLLG